MDVDYRLYLCTDSKLAQARPLVQVVEDAIRGGVTMVQVREKHASSREFYQVALAVKEVTTRYHIPLIVNDRADIALAVGADGVHIGQTDLPLPVIKKMLPGRMLVGVSVSTAEEARRAQAHQADYVGVSPVFLTETKPDAVKAVGLKGLEAICAALTIPAVAIGGINHTNIDKVVAAGAAGVAVISAIMSADDPRAAAQLLCR